MAFKKTIFFDLGNVLLFFSLTRMFEQISQVLNISPLVLQKEFTEKGTRDNYERGLLTTQAYHKHLCKLAGKDVVFEDLIEAASNIFNPNRAILPLLTELKRKGHRLFILSNTCEAHFSYALKNYPEMLAPFEGYILSYEVGALKPEEAIFRKALEKADAHPSHCFYTDDIPLFIEAASRVDIPGVVFTGVDPLMETLRSRGLL